MSNHSGSYLINNVLIRLDDYEVFTLLGKEKTLQLLSEIRKIGRDYDCNDGEILDEIGEKLNICYQCWKYGDSLDFGVCVKCCANYNK